MDATRTLVVVRLGDRSLTVLAADGVRKAGQKLANASKLRGPAYRSLEQLVHEVFDRGAEVARDGFVGVPIADPEGRSPFAVAVGSDGAVVRAAASETALWVWTLPAEPGPPQLHLTAAAADLLGIDIAHRDRAVHGVVDFFSRALSLGQTLEHLDWLFSGGEPAVYSEDMPVRRDDAGLVVLDVVEAKVDDHVRVGVGWQQQDTRWGHNLADALFADALVAIEGRHVALLDVRFPASPFVLRWLGGPPPGIGHGLSTGQNSGFHPDDRPAVAAAVIEAATRGPRPGASVVMSARVRTLDGQWMRLTAKLWWVAHDVAPGIVAVAVQDQSIEQ